MARPSHPEQRQLVANLLRNIIPTILRLMLRTDITTGIMTTRRTADGRRLSTS